MSKRPRSRGSEKHRKQALESKQRYNLKKLVRLVEARKDIEKGGEKDANQT